MIATRNGAVSVRITSTTELEGGGRFLFSGASLLGRGVKVEGRLAVVNGVLTIGEHEVELKDFDDDEEDEEDEEDEVASAPWQSARLLGGYARRCTLPRSPTA